MTTCTRRIQFCAGHRVMGHENKCANLHGHNYVALFSAHADLDNIGRVIDFGVLKEKLGGWIDKHWDHGFLLYSEDAEAIKAVSTLPGQKMRLLQYNPTAENMAHYLLHEVCPAQLHNTGVQVVEVTLWETENCYATSRIGGADGTI